MQCMVNSCASGGAGARGTGGAEQRAGAGWLGLGFATSPLSLPPLYLAPLPRSRLSGCESGRLAAEEAHGSAGAAVATRGPRTGAGAERGQHGRAAVQGE